MRKLFLFLITFANYLFSYAQQGSSDLVYESYQVDSLPQLYVSGRLSKIEDFLSQNIKWKEGMNEDEKIVLSYYVDKEGYIRSIDIREMPKQCELCTKEFIRVFSSVPKMRPAIKEGTEVQVKQKIIFYFKIKRQSKSPGKSGAFALLVNQVLQVLLHPFVGNRQINHFNPDCALYGRKSLINSR